MANKYKWTIIFLVSAENNLIQESIKAVEEIYSVPESDEVKFLVIFDGLKGEKFSEEFARPSLYEVSKANGFFIDRPVMVAKKDDLSDERTLCDLFAFVKDNYPAEKFGFFYKGHGGAGENDITSGRFYEKLVKIDPDMTDDEIDKFIEEKFPKLNYEGNYAAAGFSRNKFNKSLVMAIFSRDNDYSLTYGKLARYLQKVFGVKGLSFVCLDCCWGQQIENACSFSIVAENFIASADETPALGLGYFELCSKIVQRPAIKAEEIANLIVAIYFYRNYADYDSPVPEFRKMGVSFTNVNTKALHTGNGQGGFIDVFNELCSELLDRLKDVAPYLQTARSVCLDYTYAKTDSMEADDIVYPVFNIDLIWFLENLHCFLPATEPGLKNKINKTLLEIKKCVVAGYLGNNYEPVVPGSGISSNGGNGITITFPVSKEHYERSILTDDTIYFYKYTGWKKLLVAHYKAIESIDTHLAVETTIRNSASVVEGAYATQLTETSTLVTTTESIAVSEMTTSSYQSCWRPIKKAKQRR